jgi:hypothetical protein
MSAVRYALKIRPRIEREMRESTYEGEYASEEAFQRAVNDAVADAVSDAEYDAACEREAFGYPEDTPCLQSADLWGTGEGQYHGVI